MQAYDHNPEQKAITESGLDSSNRAGDKMMQEVLSTDIKDWRALFQRGDAGKSNVFDRQWQADSGGRLVQLDMISGKLLTHNDRGDKVDYESQSDNERMKSKSSLALSSFFMLSPMAMLGMGTTFAIMDQAETRQQSREVDRLRQNLTGNGAGTGSGQEQARKQELRQEQSSLNQASRPKGGYTREIMEQSLGQKDDKRRREIEEKERAGLIEKQKKLAFDKFIKDVEQGKQKRKKAGRDGADSKSDMLRRRSRMKNSMSVADRLNIGRLNAAKRIIEDRIERRHADGTSLKDASRLHSQLETLDRAIYRLSQLGY